MKANIAVTSQNKKTITKHAGECRNYLIYTVEDDKITDKKVLELEPEETLKHTFHSDQSTNPANKLFDVDVLLTGSIGPGGVNKLARQNVAAYVIKEKDPDLAVEMLLKGTLKAYAPVSHHHHDHDHHGHHHHEHAHEGGGCGGNCGGHHH